MNISFLWLLSVSSVGFTVAFIHCECRYFCNSVDSTALQSRCGMLKSCCASIVRVHTLRHTKASKISEIINAVEGKSHFSQLFSGNCWIATKQFLVLGRCVCLAFWKLLWCHQSEQMQLPAHFCKLDIHCLLYIPLADFNPRGLHVKKIKLWWDINTTFTRSFRGISIWQYLPFSYKL